jgi:hypothetical protein
MNLGQEVGVGGAIAPDYAANPGSMVDRIDRQAGHLPRKIDDESAAFVGTDAKLAFRLPVASLFRLEVELHIKTLNVVVSPALGQRLLVVPLGRARAVGHELRSGGERRGVITGEERETGEHADQTTESPHSILLRCGSPRIRLYSLVVLHAGDRPWKKTDVEEVRR